MTDRFGTRTGRPEQFENADVGTGANCLENLVGSTAARLPQLIDDVYEEAVQRIDLYRDDDIVPQDDLHRSIAANLRFMLNGLADPRTVLADMSAPDETGRTRARQGAPLPEVLRVYRIGCAMLWNTLVDCARDDARSDALDALVVATRSLWELTDEHALVLTEAYRAATAELLAAQQRRRSALVEALLNGRVIPNAGPWEAGKLLGLSPEGSFAVVVAETCGLAEESLLGIERRLGESGMVSAWNLTPTAQAGIVSLRDDQCSSLIQALRESATARTGVSPPYRYLNDTPRALHLARVALAEITPEKAEVRTFNASPLAAFIAHDPDEGRRLAEDVFGAMLDLPREDRAELMKTLRTFVDSGGSSERTARSLYCHPNTVRYRLRRVRELTGRSLSDPHSLAELVTASYALSLNQEGDTRVPPLPQWGLRAGNQVDANPGGPDSR